MVHALAAHSHRVLMRTIRTELFSRPAHIRRLAHMHVWFIPNFGQPKKYVTSRNKVTLVTKFGKKNKSIARGT